jgi:hypothetical protein
VSTQGTKPDAFLEVTVQQRDAGKLAAGLHRLLLSCTAGECSLEKLNLNQCVDAGNGVPVFVPTVEYTSTRDGRLSVSHEGRTFVVRESGTDIGGSYVNTFRFEYAPPARQARAITQLVGFSGAFLKNSSILGKVISVEYVPLPKAFQAVRLDCAVSLPGVSGR